MLGYTQQELDGSELEHIHLFGLLYQMGYLTIQSRDEFGLYTLDYPNREVKNLMLACFFEAFGR